MRKTIQPRSIEEKALFFKKNTGKIKFEQTDTATSQLEILSFDESENQNINTLEIEEDFSEIKLEEQINSEFDNLEDLEDLDIDSEENII
jgi:hypothetical protein